MNSTEEPPGSSLVTAILPRQSAGGVLAEVLSSGGAHAMMMSARGTMMQGSWLKSLLPSLSPEREILQFIVPDQIVKRLMEQIVMAGKLHQFGAGSIYASPCVSLSANHDFPLWSPEVYQFESSSFDISFKSGLTAVTHITDRDAADPIARAAIKAGAQGATITFIRGYGLRDKLGLLRITKRHDKELITVVVDEVDLDPVFRAMSQVGRVDQPGRGIIYQMPISAGLTNLSSIFQPKKHSASIQQMVRAIDELKGNSDWRANQLLFYDQKSSPFDPGLRTIDKGLKILTVLSRRKDSSTLLDLILEHGVPGATVGNWRFYEADAGLTKAGKRLNREFGSINLITSPSKLPALRSLLADAISSQQMDETCVFAQDIPLARSFAPLGD
jgi:nitrogen regulatory protein PII